MVAPIGSIIAFAGEITDNLPSAERTPIESTTGWLLCNGRALNRTDPDYTALFNVIQYYWGGSGDMFQIPDLRGYFLRGVDGQNFMRDPDRAMRTGPFGTPRFGVGSFQEDATRKPINNTITTFTSGEHDHEI
jgi:hypothetical protein